MKKILFFTLFIFINISIFGQQLFVEAKITQKCVTQPGTISIEKNHEALGFKTNSINAGSNCYNGNSIKNTGFSIKNSLGDVVYSSKSSKKLSDLRLLSGIYKLYVDGGSGAYLKLEYTIK